jgi:hypothetical protein
LQGPPDPPVRGRTTGYGNYFCFLFPVYFYDRREFPLLSFQRRFKPLLGKSFPQGADGSFMGSIGGGYLFVRPRFILRDLIQGQEYLCMADAISGGPPGGYQFFKILPFLSREGNSENTMLLISNFKLF